MMRKTISMILVIVLLFTSLLSVSGCGEKSNASEIKIGIMHTSDAAINVSRKEYCDYLEENVEGIKFIHSEAISTVEQELQFVENAHDMGCVGIASFAAAGREESAEKAKSLGMYYSLNGLPLKTNILSNPNFVGCYTASHETAAESFKEILTDFIGDGEKHGTIILSVLAPRNNEQQKKATVASLEALQAQYGLTYETPIAELAVSPTPIEAKNDKGIDIYILPGGDNSMVASLVAILQTNKYDTIIMTAQVFTATAQALTDYKMVNPKLKVAAKVQVSESASSGMSSGLLDAVVLNASSINLCGMIASIYNAATGNMDILRDGDGKALNAVSEHYTAKTYEEYKWFEQNDEVEYLADAEYFKSMLKSFNKELTAEKFSELYTADLVAAKKSGK